MTDDTDDLGRGRPIRLPLPRKPIPNLPPPPDDEHDTAEAWADHAAELFRQRADWRMARTAAAIAQALAAAEASVAYTSAIREGRSA